jgi:hypothetical protein
MTLVECGAAAAAAFPLPSHLCHLSRSHLRAKQCLHAGCKIKRLRAWDIETPGCRHPFWSGGAGFGQPESNTLLPVLGRLPPDCRPRRSLAFKSRLRRPRRFAILLRLRTGRHFLCRRSPRGSPLRQVGRPPSSGSRCRSHKGSSTHIASADKLKIIGICHQFRR